MSDHDPLCPLSRIDVPLYLVQPGDCRCDLIAKVRADQNERIAQAIDDLHTIPDGCFSSRRHEALLQAATIARAGGGQDA